MYLTAYPLLFYIFKSVIRTASCVLCASIALAQQLPQKRNWFNDPFFQVSAQVPNCPVPAGPFLTEQERRAQAHYRAERGTSCWLAGNCDRPSSYAYDQGIAEDLQSALRKNNPVPNASLWVTVQRRIVFVEGCVADERASSTLEAFMRAIPNVEQVVVSVYSKPSERPPYKLLTSP